MNGVEVRCPNERPHGKYSTCGNWLGGVVTCPSVTILPCSRCGLVYRVTVDSTSGITYKKMTGKVQLESKWRFIDNERE